MIKNELTQWHYMHNIEISRMAAIEKRNSQIATILAAILILKNIDKIIAILAHKNVDSVN